jgi:hypothetical protein
MLGIAGSSALMLRTITAQAGERRATRQAGLRFTLLAAGGCANARGGDAVHPGGLRESWRVSELANGARTIDEALEWVSRGRPRRLALRGGIWC